VSNRRLSGFALPDLLLLPIEISFREQEQAMRNVSLHPVIV
jgi:hypothetical protein